MEYKNVRKAKFLTRPNRFLALIEIDGKEEICHVKNTGRCRELLIPGVEVYVEETDRYKRKTGYDLVTVRKGQRLINIDSQAPNKVFYEWAANSRFFQQVVLIRPEYRYHDSRLDFYLEAGKRKILVEVKGVTLEEDNIALFPDAPTQRGIKHINGLIRAVEEGYEAYVVFIIQMKDILYFIPNYQTHRAFGDTLKKAAKRGVKAFALDCWVGVDYITAADFVEVRI